MNRQERTSAPLNSTGAGGAYKLGALSAEEKSELIAWLAHVHTNADPNGVLPVPQCYRHVLAWQQMYGSNIVDERNDDVKPWNMSQQMADYWADVWYASRVSMLMTVMREKAMQEATSDVPNGMLFGKKDNSTGRA
jgi:hypothetical protein